MDIVKMWIDFVFKMWMYIVLKCEWTLLKMWMDIVKMWMDIVLKCGWILF